MNKPNLRWSISGRLARASRPGYPADTVYPAEVDAWISLAQTMGLKAVICLLTDGEISEYYGSQGIDLLSRYREAGFTVLRVPVSDHREPPVTPEARGTILRAMPTLPAPWVIHCSAGIDRTGMVIAHLLKHLGDVGSSPTPTVGRG